MCGIVALYSRDGEPVDRDTLAAMRDTMVHRGPDDAGLYIEGSIGLGHRRLSIIDLSSGARQPMADTFGGIWLTFNGEIYNFAALRDEYVSRGYRFKTHSDTETILAAYVLDGDRFVERLNGIFAFAIWDTHKRRLLLVRDRMGVKPLYVWRDSRLVAAASEIKALLAHPVIRGRADMDHALVPEYLAFRHFSGHKTLLNGIVQIPPGHMLVFDESGEHEHRYWALPYCVPDSTSEEADDLQRVETLLGDATRLQMVSDVPLGTFNSGGIDSSLVTAFAAETAAGPLNTFSVGFDDPRFDERPYAQLVANKYATTHRCLVIDDREYAEHLPRVIWHHDEPLSHHHTVQLYLLSRLARRFVTVVLTGEGSDELFAGYPRYRSGAALQLLGPAQKYAWNLVARVPTRHGSRFAKAKRALRLGALGTVVEATRFVGDEDLAAVLDSTEPAVRPERLPTYPLNGDLVARMLEQDQRTYLHALLMRLDKVTMAASLEARVPFLDHRLVELASRISSTRKLHRWKTKYLIKRLAARRLPPEVVFRRKMGFPVPIGTWLRNPDGLGRYLDLLLEPRSIQRGYLKRSALERVIDKHRRGERDHHELLWGLINLELWFHVMRDRTCAAPAPAAEPRPLLSAVSG